MKVPAPPEGYLPTSLIERRMNASEEVLLHNRRRGWLLRLAADLDLTLPPHISVDAAAELVVQLLPDLFPDRETAARYAANTDDADVAMTLLSGDPTPTTHELPSGTRIEVLAAPNAATYVATGDPGQDEEPVTLCNA